MGILLTLSEVYVPHFIRRRRLEGLLAATADAFRTAAPRTAGLSLDECLSLYARFTRDQADVSIRTGGEHEAQRRLFDNACSIGRGLRKELGLRGPDVMRTGRVVYRMLGIDFRGSPDGAIVISRCFFSAHYSAAVCRLISSLDAGLLAGLAGGGRLTFSQRITEGNECCRARFDIDGGGR